MYFVKFISVAVMLLFSITAHAAYIFLKSGEIKKGTIVKDHIVYIVLELEDGKKNEIKYKDIMRTIYTKLNLNKIYIQKRDGKSIEAYKVDEDSETITFRKVLNKPEEFKLNRSEILFIAEKNPSGLTGKTSQHKIDLEWYPPYNKVNEYNVYIKTKDKDSYMLAKKTGKRYCTLSGLKSNTSYFLIVKAVDTDKYESSPSNEIEVTTLNVLPLSPEDVSLKTKLSKDGEFATAHLKWKEAVDPDGKIKSYAIYQEKGDDYKKIGETSKLEYIVRNLAPERTDYFCIRAIDDKDGLSEKSSSVKTMKPSFYGISFTPSFLLPWGDIFGKMYSAGCGGFFNLTRMNILHNDINIGIRAGFFYLSGKYPQKYAMMIPLLATVNYNIIITGPYRITPVFSVGPSLDMVKYNKTNETNAVSEPVSAKWSVEPLIILGVNAGSVHKWGYFTQFGIEYAIIPEQDGIIHMMLFSIGAGMKL